MRWGLGFDYLLISGHKLDNFSLLFWVKYQRIGILNTCQVIAGYEYNGDKMLTKEKLEKQLRTVDPQLRVAFAARCSLRVLPLLVNDSAQENFSYWHVYDRGDYLLALLSAQRYAINVAVANSYKIAADPFVAAAAEATRAASGSASAFAVSAAVAYASASYDDAAYTAAVSADAADAAVYTNIDFDEKTLEIFKKSIISDLNKIINSVRTDSVDKKHVISSGVFMYSPLWAGEIPNDWQSLYPYWKRAALDLNEGFDIWVDWYEDRINGVPLDFEQEKKWLSIPSEIREQGAKATNAYFASLFSETLSPLNLVRAIFIGDGAVGKTSLIRRLHGESTVEGKEEMTPGIQIKQWALPNSEIKARFWDFGGQVMSHSMHQFFLRERCLYILLVDAGSEREKREHTTANDRAEYWLEHIKAFGNSSPVMLVGNKADKEQVNLDMNALREKYPNIIDFYPVSCTSIEQCYLNRFQTFHDDLVDNLKRVDTYQVMFTLKQFDMLNNLRERSCKSAFLDHDAFNTLCLEHEIGKVGLDKTAFLGLLDSLGEIVHFPELEWSEAYVLNPRWLTYGVYTLLYAKKTDEQLGLLSNADLVEILQAEKVEDELGNVLDYPKSKCRFIVDAMSRFGLCYEMVDKTKGEQKRLVIPDKLPKNQPDLQGYFKETDGTLAFEFDFDGLLPRSLMPNLIVSRHKEILETKEGKQLVWQHGVILHNPTYKAKARLQVDYIQRRLQLWVQGAGLREYLAVLRDEVHRLLNPIKGLVFAENVVLPHVARVDQNITIGILKEHREKAPYNRLVKEAARGQTVTSSDYGVDYDLKKVMGFIMTEEQQKKASAAAGIVNNFTGTTNIAAQSFGNHNKVSGKITIGAEHQQAIGELKKSVTDLMKHVQNHDADFEIKANAYAELKQIREHLDALETASPETRGKLHQLLAGVKDGTLGAVKLGQEIKDAEETVSWLMTTAATVSTFLANVPLG